MTTVVKENRQIVVPESVRRRARLAGGLTDVKAGRLHGPFDTHEKMIDFLHAEAAKAKAEEITKSKKR